MRDYFLFRNPELEVGQWWNRAGDEIDLVAVDKMRKLAYVGEIKLGKNLGKKDLERLIELSERIKELNNYTIHYILVALKIFAEDAITISLNELEREMRSL